MTSWTAAIAGWLMAGGGARLGEQVLAAVGGAGLRPRHRLQRDLPAEPGVLGEQHRTHAAVAEFAQDSIRADGGAAHGAGPRRGRCVGPGDRDARAELLAHAPVAAQ